MRNDFLWVKIKTRFRTSDNFIYGKVYNRLIVNCHKTIFYQLNFLFYSDDRRCFSSSEHDKIGSQVGDTHFDENLAEYGEGVP